MPPTARTGAERHRTRSGQSGFAGAGSERNGFRIRTIAGTHLALTSSRPGHTRVSPLSRNAPGRPTGPAGCAPPRQSFGTTRRTRRIAGSHLGSTLTPGRAVLTVGVFRRCGSVACVRAEASPSEVLAAPIVHARRGRVNSLPVGGVSVHAGDVTAHHRLSRIGGHGWVGALRACGVGRAGGVGRVGGHAGGGGGGGIR